MGRHVCGVIFCAVSVLVVSNLGRAQPPPVEKAGKPVAAAERVAAVPRSAVASAAPRPGSFFQWSGPGGDKALLPSPGLNLVLPAPANPAQPTAKATPEEITARYLPPVLAEPDRPSGERNWEVDPPAARKDWSPGPFVHPVGKSDLATSCVAPPDPDWLTMLKAEWALDNYGNAEPLPGQASYWPFPCY